MAMAGEAVYIVMVGDRDGRVRRTRRIGNCVITVGDRRMDDQSLCRLNMEQSPAPGSSAGDCLSTYMPLQCRRQ